MRTLNAKPELEAYLRLSGAGHSEWLAAISDLLECEGVACHLGRPQSLVGSVSALNVEDGRVCVLDVCQDLELTGCRLPRTLLVATIHGAAQVLLQGGSRLSAFPLAIVPAGQTFSLKVSKSSRLALVHPLGGGVTARVTARVPTRPQPGLEVALAGHIHRFLLTADYFQDHQDATRKTLELLDQLEEQLVTGQAELPEELPVLDRRLVRVIEKIHSERDWDFDLGQLAHHSGASERNLYYLMKRETGMTPYRFYQRCRLVRVRKRLVDCQCDVPHISWYAADEGFTHLGRFAALYRQHFGELPSETVQWRRRLPTEPVVERARLAMT